MRQLLLLLVLGLGGLGGYVYFFNPSLLEKYVPALADLAPRSPREAVIAGMVAADAAHAPSGDASAAPTPAPALIASAPRASSPAQPADVLVPIRLKDGTVITGKVVITDPDTTWIRTGDGKTREVPTRDIRSGLPASR